MTTKQQPEPRRIQEAPRDGVCTACREEYYEGDSVVVYKQGYAHSYCLEGGISG